MESVFHSMRYVLRLTAQREEERCSSFTELRVSGVCVRVCVWGGRVHGIAGGEMFLEMRGEDGMSVREAVGLEQITWKLHRMKRSGSLGVSGPLESEGHFGSFTENAWCHLGNHVWETLGVSFVTTKGICNLGNHV